MSSFLSFLDQTVFLSSLLFNQPLCEGAIRRSEHEPDGAVVLVSGEWGEYGLGGCKQ